MDRRLAATTLLIAAFACSGVVRDDFGAAPGPGGTTQSDASFGIVDGGSPLEEPCDAGGSVILRFADAGEEVLRHRSPERSSCAEDAPCIEMSCGRPLLSACAEPDGGPPCIAIGEGTGVYIERDGASKELVDASLTFKVDGGTIGAVDLTGEFATCAFHQGPYGCE